MYRLFPLLICMTVFCTQTNAQGGFTSVRDWPMPAGSSTGLSKPGFKVVPRFEFTNLGSEKHLILKMDVEMGTARNPIGPFSFRYTFHNKEYTDQDLGFDPFTPIRMVKANFSVRVQGPNLNKQVLYESNIGHLDLGIVGKNELLSTYAAHVQGLEGVVYAGEENIQRAIAKLEDDLRKKKEASTQIQQEEKKPVIADQNKNTSNTTSSASNNTPKSNPASKDDFWSQKKTTQTSNTNDGSGDRLIPEQPSHKNLPEFIRTTDGRFYQKRSDGRIRELTEQEFKDAKIASAAKSNGTNTTPAEKQLSAEEIKAIIEQPGKDMQRREQEVYSNITRLTNAWQQNFYHSEAIRTGKQNLAELSTLSGDYNSIQELEADFRSKYNSIRSQVNQLEESRNAKLNNAVNYSFNGSSGTATEQAIGEGVKLIGTLVNSAKAAKEEKEAKAALKAAREREEAELIAAKIKARNALREQLMKSFPNGGTPLTSHKINLPAVYMFGYIVDKNSVNNENATISVSNVFPVNQYSDGTYPLRTTVAGKLRGMASGEVILIGFYGEKTAAEQMRNSFINLAQKSELNVKQITLKMLSSGSPSAGAASGDFWETGKKTLPASDTTKKKKDSFWNN